MPLMAGQLSLQRSGAQGLEGSRAPRLQGSRARADVARGQPRCGWCRRCESERERERRACPVAVATAADAPKRRVLSPGPGKCCERSRPLTTLQRFFPAPNPWNILPDVVPAAASLFLAAFFFLLPAVRYIFTHPEPPPLCAFARSLWTSREARWLSFTTSACTISSESLRLSPSHPHTLPHHCVG